MLSREERIEFIKESILDYYQVWDIAFKNLFGWNKERVRQWAKDWERAPYEPGGTIVFDQHPLDLVAKELIPKSKRHELYEKEIYRDVFRDLLMALHAGGDLSKDASTYNWTAVQKRIKEIKEEYGLT